MAGRRPGYDKIGQRYEVKGNTWTDRNGEVVRDIQGKGFTTRDMTKGLLASDIHGLVEVREDNTRAVADAIDQAVARALEKIGLAAEGYAKRACPVDTGRLRNSVTHLTKPAEKSVYVGTNVEYAPYVELGTSRTKAQPFLRPAAADHAAVYRSILKSELGS